MRSSGIQILALLLFLPTAGAESWTDVKGREIEAEFVRVDGSYVFLKMGNREHRVPLNQLTPESRDQANAMELLPRFPPIEAGEVDKFKARGDEFAKAREKLREMPDQGRLIDVFFLQRYMELERDLALLATPADGGNPKAELPESLKRAVRPLDEYRIRWLRQRIRDGERELSRYRLGRVWSHEPLKFVGRSTLVRQLYELEAELDGHYSRSISALRKAIEAAAKELKKEKATFKREEAIARISGEIEKAETDIQQVGELVYGFPTGGNLGELPPTGSGEVEELRETLRGEQDSILKGIRGAGGIRGRGEIESGMVGGYEVYSSKLGVVLDVSGSMSNHIARLKKEIAENFSSPLYREIPGCSLIPGLSFDHQTMLAIEELIVVGEADAIYWFCDLRDGRALPSVRRLRFLLRSRGVSFYLKSVSSHQPSEILESLMSNP